LASQDFGGLPVAAEVKIRHSQQAHHRLCNSYFAGWGQKKHHKGAPSKETLTNEKSTTNTPDRLMVVVSRRIRPGREAELEKTMQSFVQFALSFPEHRASTSCARRPTDETTPWWAGSKSLPPSKQNKAHTGPKSAPFSFFSTLRVTNARVFSCVARSNSDVRS
jgi:hypothetical protein